MKVIPLILSGGAGSRLWPVSRNGFPKQFMPLSSDKSMLQETVLRVPEDMSGQPIIICNEDHRFIVEEQLAEINRSAEIVLEPVGRNTAPAIAVGALLALQQDPDAHLVVMPSDHVIGDIPAFHKSLEIATSSNLNDKLITFGVIPKHPATGYGYIERGSEHPSVNGVYEVKRFKEKPNEETAQSYVQSGSFYWNSGIFSFKAKTYLDELGKFNPEILAATKGAVEEFSKDMGFVRLGEEKFKSSPADSIDYAIFEHTENAVVIPISMKWNDIGSWSALMDIGEKDEKGNVVKGKAIFLDTKDSFVYNEEKLITTIGLSDIIIVNTDDALLVSHKDCSEDVKKLVEGLKVDNKSITELHTTVRRPWGSFQSLESSANYQVKNIKVKPGASISLQLHNHRSEHWVVVKGQALVTLGDEVMTLGENESIYIPVGVKHRLENAQDTILEIIEVQTGTYLGEDDIVRFEDIYGREK